MGDYLITSHGLYQAVRSYLHFSQLSAWYSSSRGQEPKNVLYRITIPGEAFASKFSCKPEEHYFPSASKSWQNFSTFSKDFRCAKSSIALLFFPWKESSNLFESYYLASICYFKKNHAGRKKVSGRRLRFSSGRLLQFLVFAKRHSTLPFFKYKLTLSMFSRKNRKGTIPIKISLRISTAK